MSHGVCDVNGIKETYGRFKQTIQKYDRDEYKLNRTREKKKHTDRCVREFVFIYRTFCFPILFVALNGDEFLLVCMLP